MASRIPLALGPGIAVLLIAACAGGENNSAPTPSKLEDRAVAFMQAAGDGDIEYSYEFLHKSFKENCSLEQWLEVVNPLIEWPTAEYRILSVDVQGSRAEVNGDYYVGETALGFSVQPGEDDSGYWILDNGQWWATADSVHSCAVEAEVERS